MQALPRCHGPLIHPESQGLNRPGFRVLGGTDFDSDCTVGILDLVASKDARDQYDPEL